MEFTRHCSCLGRGWSVCLFTQSIQIGGGDDTPGWLLSSTSTSASWWTKWCPVAAGKTDWLLCRVTMVGSLSCRSLLLCQSTASEPSLDYQRSHELLHYSALTLLSQVDLYTTTVHLGRRIGRCVVGKLVILTAAFAYLRS